MKLKRINRNKKKHPIIKWTFKIILFIFIIVGFSGGLYVYKTLKSVPTITRGMLKTDNSANLYANDGKTLIWSSAKYKRKYVSIKDVPNTYKNLLLATEDANYYHENGASLKGLTNAMISYAKSKITGGQARGGSGIEQQLIKLSVFSTNADDRTVSRKIKELYLSMQLDKNYSKDKILEFYINKIWLGENSYGAQTISYTYFGKPLKALSIEQQAIIAGLGQSPSAYNLYNNPKLVEQRRNIVLQRGLQQKAISKKQYKEAINTSVTSGLKKRFWQADRVGKVTGEHNAFVTSALTQINQMGYKINKTPIQVTTSLDLTAENHIRYMFNHEHQYFQNGQQAAITITDPKTGNVLVQIGGRDSNKIGSINRATGVNRSSGSAIKPILDYGPAFENYNWATNHPINSSAFHYAGTNIWAYDYGGSQHANTNVQVALRQSYNAAALRTLQYVGPTKAKSFINKLGINTSQPLTGSTAISMNVSTEEMAGAIGAFGQSGVYHPTSYIKSMKFADNSIKTIRLKPIQAMRPSTAYVMTSILEGVFSDKGTAADAQIKGMAMAGKTGTNAYPNGEYADSAMDLWTIGYTKSISTALWYGYDTPMKPGNQLSELLGDSQKDKLYKAIMEYMNKGKDTSQWKKPSSVKWLSGSGLNAQYVATDKPKKETSKSLDKVGTKVTDSYPANKDTNHLNKVRPKIPKMPKDYVIGQWKSKLTEEQQSFSKKHKNDLSNAKKVGADE